MKVALLFTGLARCFEQAHPSIKREILDVYQPDVFFDIWSEVGYYSGKGYLQGPADNFVKVAAGDKGFHNSGEMVNVQRIVELYNPAYIHLDNFTLFEPIFDALASECPNAYTRPKNTIAMTYKWFSAINRLQISTDIQGYDLIIRMRPDLVINSSLSPFNPSIFYTIRHRNKNNQGTGDGFQVGSPDMMREFAYAMDFIPEMYNLTGVMCPHLLTEFTIQKLHLPWQELSVEFVTAHSPKGPYQEPE